MASTFLPSLSLLLLLTLLTPSISTASSRTDVLGWSCNNSTVADVEAYRKSYQVNLDAISDGMRKDKFAIHEDGIRPQKMYMLSQCISDLSPDECNRCWLRATELLTKCLPATGGRFYLDGCFVRFDNYYFYREPVTHYDPKICASEKELDPEFKDLVKQTTKSIVETAPYSEGYSVTRKGTRELSVYGLGMCWKTLDEDLCQLCLADGALQVSKCLPSKEGFALNAGCYLRYSNHSFYKEPDLLSTNVMTGFFVQLLVLSLVCLFAIAAGFWCGKCIYSRASEKKIFKG